MSVQFVLYNTILCSELFLEFVAWKLTNKSILTPHNKFQRRCTRVHKLLLRKFHTWCMTLPFQDKFFRSYRTWLLLERGLVLRIHKYCHKRHFQELDQPIMKLFLWLKYLVWCFHVMIFTSTAPRRLSIFFVSLEVLCFILVKKSWIINISFIFHGHFWDTGYFAKATFEAVQPLNSSKLQSHFIIGKAL